MNKYVGNKKKIFGKYEDICGKYEEICRLSHLYRLRDLKERSSKRSEVRVFVYSSLPV